MELTPVVPPSATGPRRQGMLRWFCLPNAGDCRRHRPAVAGGRIVRQDESPFRRVCGRRFCAAVVANREVQIAPYARRLRGREQDILAALA